MLRNRDDFEGIMLSEISPSQKNIYGMIPLSEVLTAAKLLETGSRMVAAKGWVRGKRGGCFTDIEFQFKMKKFQSSAVQ